eukprot:438229-Prymnesium_polylepis.1
MDRMEDGSGRRVGLRAVPFAAVPPSHRCEGLGLGPRAPHSSTRAVVIARCDLRWRNETPLGSSPPTARFKTVCSMLRRAYDKWPISGTLVRSFNAAHVQPPLEGFFAISGAGHGGIW